MTNRKWQIFILIMVTGVWLNSRYFFPSNLYGAYFTVGQGNNPSMDMVPVKPDTLVLRSDKTFASKYYGEGTYEIIYKVFETRVRLVYMDFGNTKASVNVIVSRTCFLGRPYIALDADGWLRYNKID